MAASFGLIFVVTEVDFPSSIVTDDLDTLSSATGLFVVFSGFIIFSVILLFSEALSLIPLVSVPDAELDGFLFAVC